MAVCNRYKPRGIEEFADFGRIAGSKIGQRKEILKPQESVAMPNLSLESLLNFFDAKPKDSQGHAAAINALMGEELALALLKDYFKGKGESAEKLPQRCNTGRQRGPRLDAWIRVEHRDGEFHYQTEIKNWSSHSVGGKSLPDKSDKDSMRVHRKERWENRFDTEKKALIDAEANKVLVPMRAEPSWKVRPLIVFWDPMHPQGDTTEFFRVDVNAEHFDELWVFSISTYVRNLLSNEKSELSVDMPEIEKRLQWVDRLLGRER